MQVSNFVIITAVEIYILLILISVFFIFYSRSQRQLIQRQQQKLRELAQAAGIRTVNDTQSVQTPLTQYIEELDKQQEETLTRYRALATNGDINLPQPTDSPLIQKILALRYQFLAAEIKASHIKDDQIIFDWTALEKDLSNLLKLQESSGDSASLQAELDINKKRIENLEKFKQLFFDMEKQWQEAKKNAQEHYSQLAEMVESVDDKAYFNDVLERYHNVYNEVSDSLSLGKGLEKHSNTITYQTIKVNRTDAGSAKEIIKLRNVAVDQHRIISQLQRKLEGATTAAEKEEAFSELQHQLERQTRFVKEAETCVQLLEDELARSHDQITQQELALDAAKESEHESEHEKERLKIELHKFALESKEMMRTISRLEQEKIASSKEVEKHDNKTYSNKMNKMKEEHLALQMRHAELEEKYLTLKLEKKP